jgi:hypothetical protein
MKRIAITGIIIWVLASLVLRLAGQYVFRHSSNAAAISLLLISLPLMVIVARTVLGRLRTAEQRAMGAIVLIAPGMALDTVSTIWFAAVFPNIRPDAAGLFGGWLLFCNVTVLLAAILLPGSSHDRTGRSRLVR